MYAMTHNEPNFQNGQTLGYARSKLIQFGPTFLQDLNNYPTKIVTQNTVDEVFRKTSGDLWKKIKSLNKDVVPFDTLLERLDGVLLHEMTHAWQMGSSLDVRGASPAMASFGLKNCIDMTANEAAMNADCLVILAVAVEMINNFRYTVGKDGFLKRI
ncbi:hypothetical protein EJ08DRAFT_251849 [Tothia fuscella]|uniref:Uncharacterized protein n=1 Tax=Tothia fuscella TaxID=1048955 RepID=A0A9P4NQZ6_9PEZI|nr:hypothetical protein EJ08DRAFT_251849 [Tothia fuscella]